MAITRIQELPAQTIGGIPIPFVLPAGRTLTAGNTAVLRFSLYQSQLVTSVSDTQGNPWQLLVQRGTGNTTSPHIAIAICRLTRTLVAGDRILLNLPGTAAGVAVAGVDEWSGPLMLDRLQLAVPSTTSTYPIGPTSITSASESLVLAAWSSTNVVVNGQGLTYNNGLSLSTRFLRWGAKVVTTSAAQDVRGSGSASSAWDGVLLVLRAATAYEQTVLADEPQSYWTSRDTIGNNDEKWADAQGRNSIWRLAPTAASIVPLDPTGRSLDYSLNGPTSSPGFNTPDDYRETGLTLECWAAFDARPTTRDYAAAIGISYCFIGLHGNQLCFRWTGSGPVEPQLAEPFAPGRAYHLVGAYNRGRAAADLYVDGRLAATVAAPLPTASVGTLWFTHGGDVDGGSPLDGRVQHAAVYRGALSEARIRAHYRAGVRAAGRLAMVV